MSAKNPVLEDFGFDSRELMIEVQRETVGKLIAAEKQIAKLRTALEEIASCVQLLGLNGWSDAPHVMKVIAAALNEETK